MTFVIFTFVILTSDVGTSNVLTVDTRARINTPLKQHLASHGISQTWLAEKLGVKRQEVWPWVNGIHVPAEATRRRIASLLGKTDDQARIDELCAELWPDENAAALPEAA